MSMAGNASQRKALRYQQTLVSTAPSLLHSASLPYCFFPAVHVLPQVISILETPLREHPAEQTVVWSRGLFPIDCWSLSDDVWHDESQLCMPSLTDHLVLPTSSVKHYIPALSDSVFLMLFLMEAFLSQVNDIFFYFCAKYAYMIYVHCKFKVHLIFIS